MIMSRRPPSSPPEVVKREKDFTTQSRRYKVITYLYGGGVEAEKADPVTIVRPSEIRGQLRFWWRATQGGRSGGKLSELRKLEEEIWGSAAQKEKPGPSEVHVSVDKVVRGDEFGKVEKFKGKKVAIGSPSSPFGYVAFPLRRERDRNKPAGKVRKGVEFTLCIRYPEEHTHDIQAALWAWETFGGIGARTRRGFGALCCTHVDGRPVKLPVPSELESEIKKALNEYVHSGIMPDGVPHISNNVRYKKTTNDWSSEIEAWKYLFGRLEKFRQSRFMKNNRPYGRSKWPEADEIRRLTGQSTRRHQNPRVSVNKFPRGQFGLPIIFQFKDSNNPDPSTLKLKDHNRLASPLIIRPYMCEGGKSVGLAVVLERNGQVPGGYVLETNQGDDQVEVNLSAQEAQRITPLNRNTDVLDAFLRTL
jgi:CRISPR-associated protein Cmr1